MQSALLPTLCLVYLCANVGPRGATHALPAPFSATLSPALSVYLYENVGLQGLLLPRSSHTPPVSVPPRCPSPPLLPVWMYVSFLSTWCWTSLLFDFLSVLVVRGGSVSTYASILLLFVFLMSLVKGLLILFTFSKKQILDSLIF